MPSAVRLREDYSAAELRALARRSKNVNQSRRRLSLAAVRDGMDRGSAAKIGGMDRQTLREWVHRFNGSGLEGLVDNWTEHPKPRLSAEQLAQFAQIVEAGPDREKDGVVRCAGSTSSASSPRGSASTFIRAMSESSSRNSASPTSVRGPVIQLRTSGPSRLSKKLPARAERSSWIPERSATRLRVADLNVFSKLGNQGLEWRRGGVGSVHGRGVISGGIGGGKARRSGSGAGVVTAAGGLGWSCSTSH